MCCCFDSALTAYHNKQTPFSITNERELNKLKLTISNLVSSGKTMLKGNKHNNWRMHKVGSNLSHEMHSYIGDMHVLSYYLCRYVLLFNG